MRDPVLWYHIYVETIFKNDTKNQNYSNSKWVFLLKITIVIGTAGNLMSFPFYPAAVRWTIIIFTIRIFCANLNSIFNHTC